MKKILALLLALTMVLSLAACGGGSKTPTKPNEVAAALLEAIKKQDTETAKKYYAGEDLDFSLDGEDLGVEDKEVTEKLVKKLMDFDYKLGDAKVDGDKATIATEFKTYDIGPAMAEFVSDLFSQALAMAFSGEEDSEAKIDELSKELTKKLVEKVDGLKEKSVTTNADMTLTKNSEGKWIVDEFSKEFGNAMLGDLEKAMEDAMGGMFDFGEDPEESQGN
ncbi:MAG: hypothetical protein IJL66_08395 [Lachnospiraceae bacterium]|nr:hypothetical protein [Lachnospiraceae bacterium]